ncbi:MAG: amidohydrolase family protein [Acidimicrobiia bacterium]|nr:amidohydrolase family protein [Acidimicrobiia bacterium]
MIDRYLADHVLPMDPAFSLYSPGFVDVAEGRVAAVGPAAGAAALAPGDVLHHVEGLLLPGLVNCHAHSPMTVLRGAGEGLPLQRWLREVIWPREARLGPEEARLGMLVGAGEMLQGGITTSAEMYFHSEAVAEGAVAAGLRTLVFPAVAEAPGWERFGTAADMIRSAVALRDALAGEDLIEVGLGPHAAYTLGEGALREVAETAAAERLPVHIHVAETRTEGDGVRARTGLSIPAYLASLGFFGPRTAAAHCVWLDGEDVAILAAHGVGVAHCPGSNGKLASGMAPVKALRSAGVAVGVGTDGPASNDNLDLWEEARLALLYSRLREGDAGALGVEEALRLMTCDAAAALGRDDLGAFLPGRRADMVRVSLEDVVYDPVLAPRDLLGHLVWAGSRRDVSDVWVGGRRVVEAGRCVTVDLPRERAALRAAAARLAG